MQEAHSKAGAIVNRIAGMVCHHAKIGDGATGHIFTKERLEKQC